MKGFAYIDFESSKKGDFYLVGTQINGEFKQTVLTEKLQGFAVHHGLKIKKPEEFADNLIKDCLKAGLKIAAYSEAEKNTLEQLTSCIGLEYLNLNSAAKKWKYRYKRADFDALPELGKTLNLLNHQRRQLRNSLYSVTRLLDKAQLDELNFPSFSAYGWMHISNNFKKVIAGLKMPKNNYDYRNLARYQKRAGTVALKHNRFDVEVLPLLHATIARCDLSIISRSLSYID